MFLFSQWLGLTLPQRNALAAQFGIPKKGATHVFSNEIKDDGYQVADIEAAITVDSLQTFLATDETDMAVLWGFLLDRMFDEPAVESVAAPEAPVTPEVADVPVVEETPAEAPVEAAEPKKGKKA